MLCKIENDDTRNTLLRKTAYTPSAEMTLPSADSDRLIFVASFNRAPSACHGSQRHTSGHFYPKDSCAQRHTLLAAFDHMHDSTHTTSIQTSAQMNSGHHLCLALSLTPGQVYKVELACFNAIRAYN